MNEYETGGGWRYCLLHNPEHSLYGIGEDYGELGYTIEILPEYESKEDLIVTLELMLSDLYSGNMPFRLVTETYKIMEVKDKGGDDNEQP